MGAINESDLHLSMALEFSFTGLELIFHRLKSDCSVYCVILQVKGHRKEDGLGNSAGGFRRCE